MKKIFMILHLVLVLCFVYSCQDKAAMAELEEFRAKAAIEAQNQADMEKLAEKVQEVYDSRDMAAFAQLYAEDATLFMPGEPEPIQGREAIEKNQAAAFRAMPDMSVKFTLISISGKYIVFEGVSQGTFTGPLATPAGDIPPTGKSASLRLACILKVNADGLVEEDRTYFDNLDFMKQLGLIQ